MPQVTEAPPGQPQTILILGSDQRWSDVKKNNPTLARNNPARSDTILLVRMDPNQEATAVLSLPRDLKVLIPGFGINKINAAYSLGGPALTAATKSGSPPRPWRPALPGRAARRPPPWPW